MTPRDTIAEMLGFQDIPTLGWICKDWTGYGCHPSHPIPNDLNFISRALPDGLYGWLWFREAGYGYIEWRAFFLAHCVLVKDTGDELADRMSLYAQVLKYLRDNDRPAFEAAVAKARKVMEDYRP